MALRELRILLNTPTMEMEDCLAALATALQLSSFEVSFYCRFTDGSDLLVIRVNVFDISRVQQVFFKKSLPPLNYVLLSLVDRCWNGTSNLKIIVVF